MSTLRKKCCYRLFIDDYSDSGGSGDDIFEIILFRSLNMKNHQKGQEQKKAYYLYPY